jgi:hypothetical protein
MDIAIPNYSFEFSDATNNLPFPNNSEKLKQSYLRWRYKGYQKLPNTSTEETTFTEVPNETEDILIDIPEVTETTGLLSGGTAAAAGGTALFGGAGSTLGTGATLATGILGATAIGAGAYGIKKIVDRAHDKGLVLPNSEFIGPGNPIHIGAAKNPSEQTAKEHDINYTNLINHAKENHISEKEFTNQVHQFDQRAIEEFEKDWKETGNWHAFAGKYGLKVKQAVEQLYGKSIYPSHSGKTIINTCISS